MLRDADEPEAASEPCDTISGGAVISVEWGYDVHSIRLSARNWAKVRRGQPLSIRGKGYCYEGEFFWDYWHFGGGINGDLRVEYGDDGGVGFFDGRLADAMIEEG